jgi:hypothetical protein
LTTLAPLAGLRELLEAHGLPCEARDEWLVPRGQLPCVRARWTARDEGGQLDVQVLLEDRRLIEECFAGLGEGDAARRNAFDNFARNSLHVLLAALWGIGDAEQVAVETWHAGGRDCTAYIGNYGTRATGGVSPPVPADLFAGIEAAIHAEPIVPGWQWFRFFFANHAGRFTFEALRDNEPWAAGLEALRGVAWEERAGYYSVRLFLMLHAA